jgi:hypothetical protein
VNSKERLKMSSNDLIEFKSKECKLNAHQNCARQWEAWGLTLCVDANVMLLTERVFECPTISQK